ncbi:MAG: ribosomal-processing cysteine protease Prp [Clostridia bacterium]|nr:ribosomal-processing cysteine protease Prp [Clostridia bacterium]
MIKVDIFKKNGNIVKIEMDGHSGYSESDDIVCASASSVAFAMANGIENVANVKFGYETGDGYLLIVLPDDLNKDEQDRTNVLTETFVLFIKELESQYPANVQVTELEV